MFISYPYLPGLRNKNKKKIAEEFKMYNTYIRRRKNFHNTAS